MNGWCGYLMNVITDSMRRRGREERGRERERGREGGAERERERGREGGAERERERERGNLHSKSFTCNIPVTHPSSSEQV